MRIFFSAFYCQLYKTILKYLILVVIHRYIFFIGISSSLYSLILYILYVFEATTCLCHFKSSRVTCKHLLCKLSIIIDKLNTLINCSCRNHTETSHTISDSKVSFLCKVYVIE